MILVGQQPGFGEGQRAGAVDPTVPLSGEGTPLGESADELPHTAPRLQISFLTRDFVAKRVESPFMHG